MWRYLSDLPGDRNHPVTFAELKKLWTRGRIGPGTRVSHEAWATNDPVYVQVKRVRGE